MMTIEEWYAILTKMTEDTDCEALIKTRISNPVVAIVPRGYDTPQRIAIYPKKTQGAGLVIENDIYQMQKIKDLLGEPRRIKGNRPHYNDIPDYTILEVCKTFLFKA